MRVLTCLILYLVFIPIALWLGKDFVPAPVPSGEVVIPLLKIEAAGDSYRSEPFALANREGVILYEDLDPLGPATFISDGGRRYVVFATSDNSNPNKNGRRYWLVLPSASSEP